MDGFLASFERLAPPVRLVAAALLVSAGTVALIDPHNSSFVYNVLAVLFATLVWGSGGFYCMRHGLPPRLVQSRVGVGCAFFLTVVASGVAVLSRYAYSWDASVVAHAARVLVSPPSFGLPLREEKYFALYPNNIPLLMLDAVQARLASLVDLDLNDLVIVTNSLFLLVGLLCLNAAARRLSHPGSGLALQIVCFVLIGLNPIMTIPYTDVPAFGLTSLTIWLIVIGATTHRTPVMWGAGLATAGVIGVNAAIKPYTLILFLAMTLAAVIHITRRPRHHAVQMTVGGALCVAALTLSFTSTTAAARTWTGLSPRTLSQHGGAMPPVHFVQMGLHDSHSPSPTRTWGGYDRKSVDRLRALPSEQRAAAIEDELKQELSQQGALGTATFLAHKMMWVWGDGMFWSQGEGKDRLAAPRTPSLVSDFNLQQGRFFPIRAAFAQGLWISLLLLLGVRLAVTRSRAIVTMLCLTVVGMTLYLMLFEGRPRYLVALLPALLMVGLVDGRGLPSARGLFGRQSYDKPTPDHGSTLAQPRPSATA